MHCQDLRVSRLIREQEARTAEPVRLSAEAFESLYYSFSHLRPFLVYFHPSSRTCLCFSFCGQNQENSTWLGFSWETGCIPSIILMGIRQHYLIVIFFWSRAVFNTISGEFVLKIFKVEVLQEKNSRLN